VIIIHILLRINKVRPGAPSSTSGRFDEIPEGTQVLVTHGPAFERLDRVQTYLNADGTMVNPKGNISTALHRREEHWGSRELLENIRRVRPGLHLHGHVKEARGVLAAFGHQPLVNRTLLLNLT
jgi:Icc-related predicted phosphoesterase